MRILKNGLKLLTENFNLVSKIVLTVWLPGSILLALLNMFVFPAMTNGEELSHFVLETRVTNLIELAFGLIYIGALVYALSQINQGIKPSYQESIKYGIQKCYKLFVTRFSSGFIIALGIVAFIIPGIVFSLQFALIDMAVVLENKQGSQARRLSKELTKGRKLRIFITMTVTIIGILIFNTLLTTVVYLPSSAIGLQSNLLADIFCGCAMSITSSLINIVLFLFYCDAKKAYYQL